VKTASFWASIARLLPRWAIKVNSARGLLAGLVAVLMAISYTLGAAAGLERGRVVAASESPAMEAYFQSLDRRLSEPPKSDAALSGIEDIIQAYARDEE
jgi:hypothetical protein